MSICKILQKGENTLNTKTEDVLDINSIEIKNIIKDMIETLDNIHDGVGLAANQIGYNKSIFIVAKEVMKKYTKDKNEAKHLICINPKIIKESKNKVWLDGEGCLSVRYYYGKVYRSKNVTLEYIDENGKKSKRDSGGLLAHIFQHEVDHLNGILFIDKARDIELIDAKDLNLNNKN